MHSHALPQLHLISDGSAHAVFCPLSMAALAVDGDVARALSLMAGGSDLLTAAAIAECDIHGIRSVLDGLADPVELPVAASKPSEPAPEEQPSGLTRLVLNVTHDCNLRCRYCYADGGSYGRSRDSMRRETAVAAVNWALQAFGGIQSVQFFGGEPMLNPLLMIEVCEYLKALHTAGHIERMPRLSMVSNGVLGDERYVELLRRYDIAVTLSIDGPEDVHDRLRGAGSFSAVDEFARRCLAAGDVRVDFECTWTPLHLEAGISVVDLMAFFTERYGHEVLHVAPVSGAQGSPLYLPPEVTARAYAEAARETVQSLARGRLRASSFSWRVVEALRNRKPLGTYCPAGSATVAVDAEGGIYPCFMFAGDQRFRVARFDADGRLADDPSDIVAAAVASCDKASHPECRDCWAAPLCSGCIGGDWIRTGDPTARSSCDTLKAIAEAVILEVVRL